MSSKTPDGIYMIRIHGQNEFIKMIDGKPHIPDIHRGKFVWTSTVVPDERIKRLRPVNDAQLAMMAKGGGE